jgi:hypothetical protein
VVLGIILNFSSCIILDTVRNVLPPVKPEKKKLCKYYKLLQMLAAQINAVS